MSIETKIVLFAGLIPGVVVGAGLLASWTLARKRARPDSETPAEPRWAAPVLLALVFLPADYAVKGFPTLWTDNAVYRYPHAALLIAAVAVLEGFARPAWYARMPLRAGAVAGAAWILGWPYVIPPSEIMPVHQFVGWACVSALGAMLVMEAADRGARHLRGPATPIVLLPAMAATPAVCFLFGSAYAAQSGAVLVAVTVASLLAGLLVRRLRLDGGGVTGMLALMYVFVLGTAFHFDPRSLASLLLIGAAPAGLGVAALPGVRDRAAWVRTIAAAGASCVPIAMALAVGGLAMPKGMY